jgi:hypothetical protein
VIACVRDPKQLSGQTPWKREFYKQFDVIGDAYGRIWALRAISEFKWLRVALRLQAKGRRLLPAHGKGPSDMTALDPFFRGRQESNAIRRQQTVTERNMGALYYERYGCVVCKGRNKPHESNGFCTDCHGVIVTRRKGLAEGKRKYADFGG